MGYYLPGRLSHSLVTSHAYNIIINMVTHAYIVDNFSGCIAVSNFTNSPANKNTAKCKL